MTEQQVIEVWRSLIPVISESGANVKVKLNGQEISFLKNPVPSQIKQSGSFR